MLVLVLAAKWVHLLALPMPLWPQCTHVGACFWGEKASRRKKSSNHLCPFLFFFNMTMSLLYSNGLWVTRSQSNGTTLRCSATGKSHHGCPADNSAATVWCYNVNMDQKLCMRWHRMQLFMEFNSVNVHWCFYIRSICMHMPIFTY